MKHFSTLFPFLFFPLLAFTQINLQQGLVAHYPFNGNANDESGNGNHGVVYGATLTEDRFGNPNSAYFFNGVNNRIEVNNGLNFNNSFSISLWVFLEANSTNQNFTLIQKGESCPNENPTYNGTSYRFDISNNYLGCYSFGGSTNHLFGYVIESDGNYFDDKVRFSSTSSNELGYYCHFVIMFELSTKYFVVYKNGQIFNLIQFYETGTPCSFIDPDQFTNIHQTPSKLKIGANENWCNSSQAYNNFFHGKIDDMRFYNRALSEEEILALYYENVTSYPITNIQVNQRPDGSGLVDVYFDLDGPANDYNLSLEVSFDGGVSYSPIPPDYLSGDFTGITPGNEKHIVWDGLGSFPNTFTNQARLKIKALAQN